MNDGWMHSSRGSALCGYQVWAVIAVQDPEKSLAPDGTDSGIDPSIVDGMFFGDGARVPADTSSSLSSPSELKISDQAELDGLLSGSGQDARQNVRSLHIHGIKRVREEWPRLPRLQHLTITATSAVILEEVPRMLRASALPALRSLKLESSNPFRIGLSACPVLEGRFEQLNDIRIKGFRMERNALDAVLRQLPNLTHLDLIGNEIGAEGVVIWPKR